MISMCLLLSPLTWAEKKPLELCRQKIQKLDSELSGFSKPDNISQCVKNLVKAGDPAEVVSRYEKESSCGFLCKSKWVLLSKTYGLNGYVSLIQERLDAESVLKLEETTGSSFTKIVKTFYDQEIYGLELLKKVISYIASVSIKAQAQELGIYGFASVEKSVEVLSEKMNSCLEVAQTEEGLGICTEQIEKIAVLDLGRHSLIHSLDQNFRSLTSSIKYLEIQQNALRRYDECAVIYYFDENIESVDLSEKIYPCVFNPLIEAFLSVAVDKVMQSSDFSKETAIKTVSDLAGQCEGFSYVSLKGVKRLKALQNVSVATFTKTLISCQKALTLGVVEKVGVATIAEHEAVLEILGAARAQKFADEVLKEELPKCLEKMENDEHPEKCENFLFSKTASRAFPIVLKQKFTEFKKDFLFLNDELIKDSIEKALNEMTLCQQATFEDFEDFLSLESVEAEISTSICLKTSILASLEKIVEIYVKAEVQNNKILVENGVNFGPGQRKKLKQDFFTCASANITADGGLNSVVRTASQFLDKCVLKLTQSVVSDVFETLVFDKLFETGLKHSQISQIFENYKSSPGNLLTAVQNAKTPEEIEDYLSDAERKIINAVAEDVIKFLVLNKSPIALSEDVISQLSAAGAADLYLCLGEKELAECTTTVEKFVMKKAVESFFPEAVNSELSRSLSGVLSASDLESYGILKKIREDVSLGSRGQEVISYIAEQIARGESIEEIQKDRRIVEYTIEVVIEPISSDLIRKLIVKKSPLAFGPKDMSVLVQAGKGALLKCLSSGDDVDTCPGRAERAVLEKAVVVYLPKAVESELGTALKGWLTEKEIRNYKLKAKITQSLTSGKVGTQLVDYIADELSKGTSAEKLKKLKRVTSYIYLVLKSYKASSKSRLSILDHIGHKVVQKEIDKFVKELNQGQHGGFFKLGFHILFAGDKAKQAFDWNNSKKTPSGHKTTAAVRALFKKVISTGTKIPKKDLDELQDLVKDSILEHRNQNAKAKQDSDR